MPREDYVLTCADGLAWPTLAPFVLSLRTHAPHARLIVFTARLDADTKTALRFHGAELHPFDAIFPEVAGRTALVRSILWTGAHWVHRVTRYPEWRRRWLQRLGGLLLPRNQARFFAYSAFVDEILQPGDRALLCDVRDIVFQADPFSVLPDAGLVLTEEEAHVGMADNPYNALWYRQTYGTRALERMATRPVNCAGVIAGECAALGALLDAIQAESVRRPHHYGADQAILNHLQLTGRIRARVLPNRGSLVWHLYGVPPDAIHLDSQGRVVDASGHVYPIIHMYDRHRNIEAAIRRRWPASP